MSKKTKGKKKQEAAEKENGTSLEDASDSAEQSPNPVIDRLQEAWQHSVGAFATDEGETQTLLGRLVALGTLSKEEARQVLSKVREGIESNRVELERRIDESIRTATARLTIPSDPDVRALREKLILIEQRIAHLEKEEQEAVSKEK